MSYTPITDKIDARLFDLVRFMRFELHQADLITDEEYSWLCYGSELAKGEGSPSPRRLESYDEVRKKLTELERENAQLRTMIKENISTIAEQAEALGRASALRAVLAEAKTNEQSNNETTKSQNAFRSR